MKIIPIGDIIKGIFSGGPIAIIVKLLAVIFAIFFVAPIACILSFAFAVDLASPFKISAFERVTSRLGTQISSAVLALGSNLACVWILIIGGLVIVALLSVWKTPMTEKQMTAGSQFLGWLKNQRLPRVGVRRRSNGGGMGGFSLPRIRIRRK